MKKNVLIFVSILFSITGYCQTEEVSNKFNIDFERVENEMPTGWRANGSQAYKFSLDSTIVRNGKYSVSIEFKDGEPGFGVWGFIIPENYDGEIISLSGYVKTENVVDGYAGLLMRIDPSIAVDDVKIKGTTDWIKYEIRLTMNPQKTENFAIGGLLTGKGKIWIDDLKILIDGKDINELKPINRNVLPANLDHEFANGSNIIISKLSNTQIENLSVLGLIWGFLKYYHPNIAKGDFNWDYELFRILPEIMNTENKIRRDEIFVKWINNLGEFSEVKKEIIVGSEIKIKPDLDWIKSSGFSNELSSLLMNVKNSDRTVENYYIGYQLYNPEFKNENPYNNMTYPDAGFRLLALYRYWNIIQYYFPYKNLIEGDWKKTLKEFIPKVINTENATEYTLAVLELIGQIHDTHANIWGDNQILANHLGKYQVPMELKFIENKPVVTGFYDEKPDNNKELEIGDALTKVNNVSIADIIKNSLKQTPASNYSTQLRDIAKNLLRTNDSVINVEFIRNNKIQKKVVKAFSGIDINIYDKYINDTCFKIINKEIAYINNGSLKRNYLPKIWKEIQNTKGLIIDNRNYPSDFPLYDLCSYLMPDAIPFVKFTTGSIITPGLFISGEPISIGKINEDYYKGKVIILVNELTQSSAEFHAMAYKVHPNALVIGSTTAGADGDLSQFSLPGGINTGISGVGIYYPDGKETQRIGIVPDIEIKPTIQGIKEGRDEVLEKAIEIINK
jgi:hypothetical protein